MVFEKDKQMVEFIKLVSPGTSLRGVIDDLVRAGLGAVIVVDSSAVQSAGIIEGGFKINCRYSGQRLFELCKMDGGIVLSNDLKKILFANVLLTPDTSMYTSETGTRHKAAERVAKQAKTLVITVSERRKKVTLYYNTLKYSLKGTDELRNKISSMLQVLEKQREVLNEALADLAILEISDLVSVREVCGVLQKTGMIVKISESLKRSFTEIGREGSITHMRYRELVRGVEKIENGIVRDYSRLSLKRSKTLLSNLTPEGLLDTEAIARLLMEEDLDATIYAKGFRFLAHLSLNEREISQIIRKFGTLKTFLSADTEELSTVLKNRGETIRGEVAALREQILSGKVIL